MDNIRRTGSSNTSVIQALLLLVALDEVHVLTQILHSTQER